MAEIKFSKKHIGQLEKIGVDTVYLFGSRVHGQTHTLSDFDFGVILKNPEKYKDKPLDVYNALYDIFIDVLPKSYLQKRFQARTHEFDLVFLQSAPIDLQFSAIRNNKILYEKNQEKRLNYEESIIKRYADLKYFYDLRARAILEKI